MRHLIACCDGTWMTAVKQSNVSRLRAAVVTQPGEPEPLYVEGAGVSDNPIDALRGGLTGADLDRSITAGYRWLAREYRPGDQVALFGYSRGAYTARSIAGMISRVGLVAPTGDLDRAVELAYARYREQHSAPPGSLPPLGVPLAWEPTDPQNPVRFIGVWDTVGALGIPAYVGVPDLFRSREQYEFLDVRLDPRIPHARHAVALDEMRGPFRPTLWRDHGPGQDVKQVWFPGDHGDVGGSHAEKGLSDEALDWMMREATEAVGITFDRSRIAGFAPDPTTPPNDMPGGPLGVAYEIALQPRPRATPRVDHRHEEPGVSPSAYASRRANGYRPTRTLAAPGDTAEVVVPAARGWTATGLYLEPGRYRFAAVGEWSSAFDRCGPAGDTSRWHLPGRLFSTVIGAGETVLRAALRNPEAQLVGTRRVPEEPWMSLLGLVADEVTDARGQVVHPDERIPIGAGTTYDVQRRGYLHAFANDAWGFYGNNSGEVRLTVTRV
ncbi:DUF2235 domain-containing protein [Pseudonocardia zijingensis]|jgi:hypothetical protein|uniref:T6SS Phospholipase effector Tle1-like catalytic domain-containing protein n=1 Tax=Pseudonocardia zijingensis TaxID=153376 RepID=A0ABP3ZY42_9PSEU